MAADWGIKASIKIRSDNTAAIGISKRLGLGTMRHLSVRHLWVQDKVKNKEIQLEKQDGKKNVADLGTRLQAGPMITNVMGRLRYRFERQPLEGNKVNALNRRLLAANAGHAVYRNSRVRL